MVIYPEVLVTPDCPTIKFRQPREQVDLDKELPRILQAQGWGCGTYFHVQFLSHDKTRLLASALFVVSEEVESMVTSDTNAYQTVTKTVFSRKVSQIGDWWPEAKLDVTESATNVPAVAMKAVWNPGKKIHQIKLGESVVYETPDKQEAREIAEGRKPIPQAA